MTISTSAGRWSTASSAIACFLSFNPHLLRRTDVSYLTLSPARPEELFEPNAACRLTLVLVIPSGVTFVTPP